MSSAFTDSQRARCYERAMGRCEVCGRLLPPVGFNLHHRQGRGMGGSKVETTCADGLVVCGMGNYSGCHAYIEAHRRWAEDRGYRVPRNGGQRPIDAPVLVRGEWLLLNADGSTSPPAITPEMAALATPGWEVSA